LRLKRQHASRLAAAADRFAVVPPLHVPADAVALAVPFLERMNIGPDIGLLNGIDQAHRSLHQNQPLNVDMPLGRGRVRTKSPVVASVRGAFQVQVRLVETQ
jgi:hypothetical protein